MLLRLFAIMLILVGLAGFLGPVFLVRPIDYFRSIELPLTGYADLAVSDDGQLFFALTHAGVIQRYSSNGEFLKNFPIASGGGLFCIETQKSNLAVHIARREVVDIMDFEGNARQTGLPPADEYFNINCALDEKIQSLENSLDAVEVVFKGGDRVIIKRKIWHYLAYHQFASWLVFAFGLVLFPEWRRGVFRMFRGKKK